MTTTTDIASIDWNGASGSRYRYWIYPLGTEFLAKPGNYAFAKQVQPGRWVPVYFGETSDLSARFDQHHKMESARRNGATHIHVHPSSNDDRARRAEESDLINQWNPKCNG